MYVNGGRTGTNRQERGGMDGIRVAAGTLLLQSMMLVALAAGRSLPPLPVLTAAAAGSVLAVALLVRGGGPAGRAAHAAGGEAALVRVVRARRHAAANRLQVALGWLQLGRTDRAAETLAGWCRQLEAEGVLLRRWPPDTAAAYLRWLAECEEAGLEVVWRTSPVPAGSAAVPADALPGPEVLQRELDAARGAALARGAARVVLAWEADRGLCWQVEPPRPGDGGDAGTPVAAGAGGGRPAGA